MSKQVISAGIRGANVVVDRVEGKINAAIAKFGADKEVVLPNTAYYLPVIYGVTGMKVETLGDMLPVMEKCRQLLADVPVDNCWTPYLGPGLDSGMATLFAFDMEEALKYVEGSPYLDSKEDPEETDADIWLGAADDIILRKRGIEFVDGSAPGFAAVVGAASSPDAAAAIAKELQEKSIYVFMASNNENGTSFAKQVAEANVQVGWNTRLVPFGFDPLTLKGGTVGHRNVNLVNRDFKAANLDTLSDDLSFRNIGDNMLVSTDTGRQDFRKVGISDNRNPKVDTTTSGGILFITDWAQGQDEGKNTILDVFEDTFEIARGLTTKGQGSADGKTDGVDGG